MTASRGVRSTRPARCRTSSFGGIAPFLRSMTMFLRSYIPGPPLDECIDRFWLCSDTPAHPPERILPSGAIELAINLSDDEIRIYDPSHPARPRRYSGAVVSGPYRDFFLIDPIRHASIIGVHFRPGRAVPVLGVPASELASFRAQVEPLIARLDLLAHPSVAFLD